MLAPGKEYRRAIRQALLCSLALLTACARPAPPRADPPAPKPQAPYAWRGVSIDVARRYLRPVTLRRLIALAAHYRLNVLHLHLTDNEAWRLPSRRYPRLPSPLHYSEAELRELDAYARAHGVTLIPEIDVPAHDAAAIRAYPALACGSSDTLCPQRATRFAFDAAAETMAIFSGPYLHTGGDEVTGWTTVQRRGFERALDAFVRRAHRTMIVWDDEADAAPADAIVEVWHLGAVAAKAVQLGHRIVAAADGPLYFDAVQGAADQEPPGTAYMSTLEEVYAFHPPPDALGVEGALWSEHIADEFQMWYALLPRAIALSVIADHPRSKPAWRRFRDDILPLELTWLQQRGYPFRIPNTLLAVHGAFARYAGVPGNQDAAFAYASDGRIRVTARSLVRGARIMYRVDGAPWRLYAAPIALAAATRPRVDAKTVLPDGRTSAVTTLIVQTSSRPSGSHDFDNIVSP